jgi:hypothetical protein
MKNKILMSVLAIGVTFNAHAKVSNLFSHLKENVAEYGIPCALAVGASFILAKEDKAAIAIAGCAGLSAVTYYHIKDRQVVMDKAEQMEKTVAGMKSDLRKELKEEMLKGSKEDLIKEMKTEVYAQVNQNLLQDKQFLTQMLTKINSEFEAYKGVIDQVLVQKLSDYNGVISSEIQKVLLEGPFVKMLEDKIAERMKDNQTKIFEEKKAEMIKQAVSDVIDEIVVKQIGIKESGVEIIDNK